MSGSDNDYVQRVIKAIATGVPMEIEKIKPESTFEELGLQSIDILNIIFALEDEFSIAIPQEMETKMVCVADIVARVKVLVEAEQAQAAPVS